MNPIKSIQEELADCRAAWAENPTAKLSWCCHHEVLVEPIDNPEERIAYILSGKPQDEQAVRFRNFRPVRAQLPEALSDEFVKARAEHEKAQYEYEKSRAEYEKAWAEYEKARAEYDKAEAWVEYEKTWAEYEKARAEYEKALVKVEKAWAAYENASNEYQKAWDEHGAEGKVHQKELERLHRQDWSNTTWNGQSIF